MKPEKDSIKMPFYLLIVIPFVSALIGYFTNWVAIRMLFRPHKEKRVLGLRVPFTPGLIPRKRAELARSIGTAVGEHLVTREAIAARFEDEEVKGKLDQIIHDYVGDLLTRDLGGVESLVPGRFRDEWEDLLESFKDKINGWAYRLLSGEEVEALIREQVKRKISASSVAEIVPEELIEEFPAQLGFLFQRLTEGKEFEDRVRSFMDRKIDSILAEDKRLSDYIPDRIREAAYAKIEEVMPIVLDRLVRILEDEQVQKRIKIQLYELVDRLIVQTFKEDSLWDQVKLGFIESFIIPPEELKERIDQGVDEIAPRAAELVKNPAVRKRVYNSLTGSLDSLLERRISEFKIEGETVEKVKEQIGTAVIGLVRSEELKDRLLGSIKEKAESLKARPIKELFPSLAAEKGDSIIDGVTEHVLQLLQEGSTQEAIAGFVSDKLDELIKRPIGKLGGYIPERYVIKGRRMASEYLTKILKRETPRMVEAIDIERLVREKVGEFETSEVERLIVGVTGDQLKAITWFGAVLGFLIGLVQVGILLIGR